MSKANPDPDTPRMPAVFEERDNFWMLLEIAQRISFAGDSYSAIARDLCEKGATRITDNMVKSAAEYIRKYYLKAYFEFPQYNDLAHKLKRIYPQLKHIRVTSCDSTPKNVAFIAQAATSLLIDIIRGIKDISNDEALQISIGCGETIRYMADHLYDRLYNNVRERLILLRKTRLMPTAVLPGLRYDTTLPNFLVANFYARLSQVLPPSILHSTFEAIVPTLPDSFYRFSAEQQYEYYDKLMADYLAQVRKSHIYLIGIGNTNDIHYQSVFKGLELSPRCENKAQINYHPIDATGHPFKIKKPICGVGLEELSLIAKKPNRFVIAIAGGEKMEIVEASLRDKDNTAFNCLVIDHHIANHLLRAASRLNQPFP